MIKWRTVAFWLPVLLLTWNCQSNNGEGLRSSNKCSCPLEKQSTKESGSFKDSSDSGFAIKGELGLDIPTVKKLITGDIDLSGNYRNRKTRVEKAYWQILNENPTITQYANLYWATTCAMYEITCEDNTISDREREAEKRQIIKEYEARLSEIIKLSLTWKNSSEVLPPPVPGNDVPEPPGINSPDSGIQESYDTVQLLIPARLNKSSVEVDGQPARIIKRNQTIIWMEIPRKNNNHSIVLRDDDRICEITSLISNNLILTINLEDCK